MTQLQVNGQSRTVNPADDEPLLWLLREQLGLCGTRFGCGAGLCGACTVHLDGEPVRSCQVTAASAAGRQVTTIEGLQGPRAQALRQAWADLQVPQCGYCQSGMLMAAEALLARQPQPGDADIGAAITNLCRCGTYPRVRAAIHRAAAALSV